MLMEHSIQIRVRYCETDAMGFLHHSQFFNYFEQGRTELLLHCGDKLLASATSTLACVDRAGKIQRLPDSITSN